MAICKIPYIGNDMQFGVPLLIILGLVFSFWSTTFFMYTLYCLLYWYIDNTLFIPVILTLLIFLVSKPFALFYGVKHNNPKLVRSWYIMQIIECILISFGITITAFHMFLWHPKYDCFIGILLLPFGVYLIACVKKIYKNLTTPSSIYQQMVIGRLVVEKV